MANPTKRRVLDFYPLESRILLSGDSPEAVNAVDVEMIAAALIPEVEPPHPSSGSEAPQNPAGTTDTAQHLEKTEPSPERLEIVFVDAGLADSDRLISDLQKTSQPDLQRLVFKLNAGDNGFDQISDALEPLSGVQAIHLLSHGNGNGIQLGNTELNLNTGRANAGQISGWADSLDTDADLLIYGCGLADNQDGRELIESLATLCECDVAASDDLTGHSDLGGDWDLEFRLGKLETTIAFSDSMQTSWMSTLDMPSGTETTVADTAGNEGKPDLAIATSGDFVVVWESNDTSSNGKDIYFQQYDANGIEQGIATRVNTTVTGDQNAPAIAIKSDGGFVVVWDGNGNQPGQADGNGIFLQHYDAQGIAQGGEVKVNSNNRVESNADIAMNADGDFVIVWESDTTGSGNEFEVYLQRFDANGTAQGSEIRVNTTTDQNQFAPAVAMTSNGDFVVAWEGFGAEPGQDDTHGVFFQRFDHLATLQGNETRINTTTTDQQGNIDVAMYASGSFVATWTADGMVQHQMFDAAGNTIGGESQTTPVTLGPYNAPSVATTATNGFVIVFDGDGDASQDSGGSPASGDIYKAVFDSDGTELHTKRVNTSEGLTNSEAVIGTSPGGESVVAWKAVTGSGDDRILMQRFNASTGPVITDGILISATPDFHLPMLPSGTLAFDNQDIVSWDGENASNHANPSFSNSNSIDAISTKPNGKLLLSVGSTTLFAGSLEVGHGDIVEYDTATGATSLFLKGSLLENGPDSYGNASSIFLTNAETPTPAAANIDAFQLLSDGNVLLSIEGTAGMSDGSGNRLALDDADIVLYDPITNSASILFDFDGIYSGDIEAISMTSDGLLILSTESEITLPDGETFSRSDLFRFNHTDAVINGVAPLEGRIHDRNPGSQFVNSNGEALTPNLNAATWKAADTIVSLDAPEGTTETAQIEVMVQNGASLNFSINGGMDADQFTIGPSTGVLSFTNPPDYEAPADANTDNVYEVTVLVEDEYSASDSLTLMVTVTDVPLGSITDGDTSADEILENEPAGRTIGIKAASSGDSVTYSLSDDDGGRFTIDPSSGVVTTTASMDREIDGETRQIEISATDGINTVSSEFMVSILPVNDHDPVIISGGGNRTASVSIAENSVSVMTILAIDADLPTETISYSITGGDDAANFTIDSVSGLLAFNNMPDFENPIDTGNDNLYTVEVTADDGNGRTDSQILNITIDDMEVSNGGQQTSEFSGTNITLNHETSGENRLMLVTVAMANHATATVNSMTYAGASLSLVGVSEFSNGASDEVRIETWSLIAPALGTHELVGALSGPIDDGGIVSVMNFASVDQTDPLGDFVSTGGFSNATSLITDSSNDDQVFSSIATEYHGDYDLLPGSDQTERWDLQTGGLNHAASIQDGGNSMTSSWTIASTDSFAALAIPIHATVLTNSSPIITSHGGSNAAEINIDEWDTNNGTPPTDFAVTSITATDADTDQLLAFSISGGFDASQFAIDSNTGQLTFLNAPDHENPTDFNSDSNYELIVQVSDGAGGSDFQSLSISVNDLDEFDVGTVTDTDPATDMVAENSLPGATTGITANATDADATSNEVIYSLSNDDGGRFDIGEATGNVTVAGSIDRETTGPVREITIRATSEDGSFTDQSFSIMITDVNEFGVAPISDSNTMPDAVNENSATGALTGITASAIDSDAENNAVTYSLIENANGRFEIDSVTGVVTVDNGTLLDREDSPTHQITAKATSSDGSEQIEQFEITINDVNEFSTTETLDLDPTENRIDENSQVGTGTGIIANANDGDATQNAITYSLDSDDNGRFSIVPSTGEVQVASAIDRESTGESSTITVRSTSEDGTFSTTVFEISIVDLDEFDVESGMDIDPLPNVVNENSAQGTATGLVVNALDADSTALVTYTLDNDAGGRFEIDRETGQVNAIGNLDFEEQASHTVTVRATSNDGSASTQSFVINVQDVNERPTATPDYFATFKTADGSVPGVLVNDTDVDGDALSVILVEDAANGILNLNSDGSFNYSANIGFAGIDSFRYQVTDGILQSESVLVQIEILAPAPQEFDHNVEDKGLTTAPLIIEAGNPLIGLDLPTDPVENEAEPDLDKTAIDHRLIDDIKKPIVEIPEELPGMENRVVNTVNMLASGTEKRVAERSSSSLTALRNMLDPETQPTVMWQDWDAIRETTETPPVLYVVGSAGSAAGIISFGYLLWILRGSTFITLLTSSAPRWRMVDPTAILSAYRGSIDYKEDRMEDMLA